MGSINMYRGADYGLDPSSKSYGSELNPYFTGATLSAGTFGIPTDPRTANQIDAVSKKISTGVKTIEVSGITMEQLDNIPKQHFKEINRLKQLTGTDLTFHGPLVDPTGITGQGGWSEQQRVQAQRQMLSAVERAHDLDHKKSVVVTFHASNGLPEAESWAKEDGQEVMKSMGVIDERTGRYGALPRGGENYFQGKKGENPQDQLNEWNKTNWSKSLSSIAIETERARDVIGKTIERSHKFAEESGVTEGDLIQEFKLAKENPEEYTKFLDALSPTRKEYVKDYVNRLNYGARFAEESYLGLQEAFNKAYGAAVINKDEPTRKKLDGYIKQIAPLTTKYEKDPEKLSEFVDEISKGIRLLNSIEPPREFRPIKEFAIDKASETFSNVALQSYNQFKESAPIISIENPPAGMGLNRADELKELVDKSREKFVEKAVAGGMSKSLAEAQADKLIGVTWDVGHINMIRKHGFTKEDTIAETAKIAKGGKYIKHIHLSDNFGLEHTELPMGMGNVPIKEQEAILKKEFGDKFKDLKHIVETGGWYQHFRVSPLAETLQAFGSPIYPMKMASYWNQTRGTPSGYFSGYGRMLPEKNFSLYGAGFSTLPTELGGQVGGGTNRLSGTPNE